MDNGRWDLAWMYQLDGGATAHRPDPKASTVVRSGLSSPRGSDLEHHGPRLHQGDGLDLHSSPRAHGKAEQERRRQRRPQGQRHQGVKSKPTTSPTSLGFSMVRQTLRALCPFARYLANSIRRPTAGGEAPATALFPCPLPHPEAFLKKVDRGPSRVFVSSSHRQLPLPRSGHRWRFARRVVLNLSCRWTQFPARRRTDLSATGTLCGDMPTLPRGGFGTGSACS